MSWQDFTNGSFELLGTVAILAHVLKLWKDKAVAGVSVPATIFFFSWGIWNLYYYPHLEQWASFLGGLGIVLGNCVWVLGLLYYSRYPGGR